MDANLKGSLITSSNSVDENLYKKNIFYKVYIYYLSNR